MDESEAEAPLLTLDEAYLATWFFIRQYYERGSSKPPEVFQLLTWMDLVGQRESWDPAQWRDWMASVEQALAHPTDRRLPPVSQPMWPDSEQSGPQPGTSPRTGQTEG